MEGVRAAVACASCGAASSQRPRLVEDQVLYLCPDCREMLIQQPSFPGYTVLRLLKEGGMGAVYLAIDEDGRRVALKAILPKVAMDRQARVRFVREASIHRKLKHPRIVEVYRVMQEVQPAIFLICMEYVEGPDAAALLEEHGGRIPERLAVRLVADTLEALAFAHAQGVVHRDLKPANLLVAYDGVKLTDFGLAKNFQQQGLTLTLPGDVGGTLDYLAPEQIRSFRDVRPPADIYSAGALLYRFLTGSFPHETDGNPMRVIRAVLGDPIVPVRARNSRVSETVAEVVERALQKDPAHRYETAEEMRNALLEAAGI